MYARCLLLFPLSAIAIAQTSIERIVVSAAQPPHVRALEDIAPLKRLTVEDSTNLLDTAALLTQAPDISLNGQGGLLQSVSLRGFSRWRVQTLLDGVPINTDRRAGTAAEFIDPAMLSGADILYGSASTYLGSNAIGGGVDFRLASPQPNTLRASYRSNPAASDWLFSQSWGNTDYKLSYRHASNASDANDQPLFDEFRQTSAFIRHKNKDHWLKESWTLYSDGRDIGKSTSLFPNERISSYPINRHWLGKLTLQPTAWRDTRASVYWHQSRLVTDIERIGERNNQVDSEALDYGASLHSAIAQGRWLGNVSLLLDGRSGVRIQEREQALNEPDSSLQTTLDAKQVNVALVADGQRELGSGRFVTGARLNWQRQQQAVTVWSDAQASGFIAYAQPLSDDVSANLFVGSAFRTPTLTERFFTGETPRGRVTGDVGLKTEHAINVQSQLRVEGTQNQFELNLFHQRIENYIERLVTGDDLQYRNLSRADVQGINYQWTLTLGAWQTRIGGQWLRGEDDKGTAVSDISPARHDINVRYASDTFSVWAGAQWRLEQNDVGSGELARPGHVVLQMGGRWQFSDKLNLNVQVQNLNDRAFFTSQDEDAPLAQGRDVRVTMQYLF